ncbi:MAG: bacillithiol biosynthesis BshC [Gemmatimonadales bacterium]|nr:MAG: bacillithiol biosynthesis BshC [Gemmatimonadales bacterium]
MGRGWKRISWSASASTTPPNSRRSWARSDSRSRPGSAITGAGHPALQLPARSCLPGGPRDAPAHALLDPGTGTPVNLHIQTLSGTHLVRQYLAGEPSALAFYPGGHPGDPAAYRAKAEEVRGRFDQESRERLTRMLTGGGENGQSRLRRFVEEGGLAVTTGQQPGLFGGPLFSLYKALTAAALARWLEEDLGVPVIPVFWVASEDHDWEEVRRVSLPDMANDLVTLELPDRPGAGELPLHRMPMGPEGPEALEALLALLPDTEFRPDLEADLRAAYREGATLPSAFAELLRRHLAMAGVFILSPEHPEAQAAALPVLLAEARGARERADALARRAGELEAAGYHSQVTILEGGANLFLEGAQGRDRLFVEPSAQGSGRGTGKGEGNGEGGGAAEGPPLRMRREGRVLTQEALAGEAGRDPALLSPGVLLRPVVESTLVPTLAYVAGPGEIAYLAQTAPVFAAHGIRPPVVHPRLSAAVVESRVEKVLRKFGLELADLSRPHHEVVGRVIRDDLPPEVREAMGKLKGAIALGSKELQKAVRQVDPTLAGPVDHVRNQGFSLLDDLEKKVVQARKRESGIAVQQIEKAQVQLFPGGTPQERVFPAVYYLVRYGPELMSRWMDAARGAVLPGRSPGGEGGDEPGHDRGQGPGHDLEAEPAGPTGS